MDIKEKWQIFADRWEGIIIRPMTFFDEWDEDEGWEPVIFFNVICGMLAGIGKTVLTLGDRAFPIVFYPIIFVIAVPIMGAVLFLFFRISGGEGRFGATAKMAGYTQAAAVVSFGIPTLGPMLGLYQIMLLTLVGKTVHKLDAKRSFIAVMLPLLLFLFLMMLISTIVGIRFWGGILSHESQGL